MYSQTKPLPNESTPPILKARGPRRGGPRSGVLRPAPQLQGLDAVTPATSPRTADRAKLTNAN